MTVLTEAILHLIIGDMITKIMVSSQHLVATIVAIIINISYNQTKTQNHTGKNIFEMSGDLMNIIKKEIREPIYDVKSTRL